MDPPSAATAEQIKEKARKAAQKKAKKEKMKTTATTATSSHEPKQSRHCPAAAPATSSTAPSYLSSRPASTTTTGAPASSTSTAFPAAISAADDEDKPGWRTSANTAWAQAQKNVCMRWVHEKREKVTRAEGALAAGRGTDEGVEEAMLELSEEIDDAIKRGCRMSELE